MVKGLDAFREFFAGHEGQFVLIGGASTKRGSEGSHMAASDLDAE
jgi:hypothetical protein